MRSLWFTKKINHRHARAIALSLGIIGSVCHANAALGLTFHFNFSNETPSDVVAGFEEAGQIWSSFIEDDVDLHLDVQFANINSPSLGFFQPERVSYDYNAVKTAMLGDKSSSDDAIAFSNLDDHSDFDLLVDFDLLINGTSNNPNGTGSLIPYVDSDGDCNNRSIRMTTANAKALGLSTTNIPTCGLTPTSQAGTRDGILYLNSNFNWDFDISDGIDNSSYDFVGVASQGMAVMMGFISGVDVLDYNVPQVVNGQNFYYEDGLFPFVSTMDLFRYSQDSTNLGVIDWTTGRTNGQGQEVDKYFSIDGGSTKIASFSTGLRNGDGYRASSWKPDELTGQSLGIMESTPASGQVLQFSENDLRLFDVIGWDLKTSSTNPPSRDNDSGSPNDPGNEDPGNEDPGNEDPGNGGGNPLDPDPSDPVSVPEPSTVLPLAVLLGLAARMRKQNNGH